jgi:hypothetical protein
MELVFVDDIFWESSRTDSLTVSLADIIVPKVLHANFFKSVSGVGSNKDFVFSLFARIAFSQTLWPASPPYTAFRFVMFGAFG